MTEPNWELFENFMQTVQTGLSDLRAGQGEIKAEIQAMRGHGVATQTDISNIYASQVKIESRIRRIEQRLQIVEEPA